MIRREFLLKTSIVAAGVGAGLALGVNGLDEVRACRHAELWAFCQPGYPVHEGILFVDWKLDVFGIRTSGASSLVMPLDQIKKQMRHRTDAQAIMPGWMRWEKVSLPLGAAVLHGKGTFVLHENEGGKTPVWMTVEDLKGILKLT